METAGALAGGHWNRRCRRRAAGERSIGYRERHRERSRRERSGRAGRNRRNQKSRHQSGVAERHRRARPLSVAVSAGWRLSPVGAVDRVHHRERESDAGGRRPDRRADPAQAGGGQRRRARGSRATGRNPPHQRGIGDHSAGSGRAAAERPQLSRPRVAGAECVAHQSANDRSLRRDVGHSRAPVCRSPGSAT